MILDVNEMAAEYIKAEQDKSRIYFIEKYLSTFNASKGKKTPFKCFPRQKAFLRALATNKNVVAIKPRQCGITTLSSAYVCAQCTFASEDAPETVLCVGNKLDLANQLITKIRDFLIQVPRWYWGEEYYSPDPKSDKNLKSIFVKDSKSELQLFNGCRIVARSSGENASRGISAVSVLVLDEAAFIENGPAVYATCAATMASNPNAKTIMVSTPNGHDELYYTTYKQALAHENNFTAVQFRWYQDPRYNKFLKWYKKDKNTGKTKWIKEPTINNEGDIKYDEEHWEELVRAGYKPTSPWYEDMCKSFNNDSVKIAQELDVSFQGSANNVVAPEFIDMQNDLNVREPLDDFKDPLNEDTWFWKKPIDGHRYICSCLPEGEQVLTQRGLINVEKVKADDLLVTKEGKFTKIKHRKYREVKDEKVINISLSNTLSSYAFTHNHPIWSSIDTKYVQKCIKGNRFRTHIHNFTFNNADEIKIGDWVEIPNFYRLNKISHENFINKWKPYDAIIFNNQYDHTIDNPIDNEEFWWFCGMWLAEGFAKKGRIVTCHHTKEKDYIDRITKFVTKYLNRKVHIEIDGNSTKIFFNCKQLEKFLHCNFGEYAYGKYITEWVKMIPEKYIWQLILGYLDGDGCYQKNRIIAGSISSKLLIDMQDLLFSVGVSSSLVKKYDEHYDDSFGKKTLKKAQYTLTIGKHQSNIIYKKFNRMPISEEKFNIIEHSIYFSDDLSKIYIKVKNVEKYLYTGKVYNFETESESHTFCCNRIATHNCDPSRGISADRTAIEIVDMDGRDENGLPIIEQVAEYVGKKLGDDSGGMIYQYATLYNNAYVVIDCTGGCGDALILTLIQLGYKNLYYEDANQKTYTVQNQTEKPMNFADRLPGFHFQGNRYPVLAGFAGMVRSNEFKIRSRRVTNELDTWIFDDSGRMDHQSGAHDDTICSLAMALFVMKYTYNKLWESKKKDEAILKSYMIGGGIGSTHPTNSMDDKPITPHNGLPFYNQSTFKKTNNGMNQEGSYLWLFSGYY